MSTDDVDYLAQRAALSEAIQRVIAEYEDGAFVTGWFLIFEARDSGDPRPRLGYRSGDVNGEGLASWQGLGFLHSALGAVDEQGREGLIDREEDEDEGE